MRKERPNIRKPPYRWTLLPALFPYLNLAVSSTKRLLKVNELTATIVLLRCVDLSHLPPELWFVPVPTIPPGERKCKRPDGEEKEDKAGAARRGKWGTRMGFRLCRPAGSSAGPRPGTARRVITRSSRRPWTPLGDRNMAMFAGHTRTVPGLPLHPCSQTSPLDAVHHVGRGKWIMGN